MEDLTAIVVMVILIFIAYVSAKAYVAWSRRDD